MDKEPFSLYSIRGCVRFIAGGIFLILSVVVFAGIVIPSFERHHFIRNGRISFVTAGPCALRSSHLTVIYPPSMRENETLPVDVSYSVEYIVIKFHSIYGTQASISKRAAKELDCEIGLLLSSSGFDIEPKGRLVEPPGTPIPIKRIWTITPKSAGNRYLLLKVEESNIKGTFQNVFPFSGLRISATINDQPIETDRNGYYKLPVSVRTYWGVSKRVASALGCIFAVIAFILMWPVTISWLKKQMKLAPNRNVGLGANVRSE